MVGALGAAPATLRSNQELTIAAAVANRGRGRAPRSAVRFYLSRDARRDAADARLEGLLAFKALKPGRSARATARPRVPGTLAAGTYRLLACADDLAKVRERNERNNCRVAAGAVRVGGAAGTQQRPPSVASAPPASPLPGGRPGHADPGRQPAPGR